MVNDVYKPKMHSFLCVKVYMFLYIPSVVKLAAEGAGAGATGQSPLCEGPPGPAGLPSIRGPPYPILQQKTSINNPVITLKMLLHICVLRNIFVSFEKLPNS